MIADFPKRLQRAESDAVRLVIREAVRSLQAQDAGRDTQPLGEVPFALPE